MLRSGGKGVARVKGRERRDAKIVRVVVDFIVLVVVVGLNDLLGQ